MTKLELIDAVVRQVFRKADGSVTCETGFCNSVCQAKGVCCVSEKSEHQLRYVVSSIQQNIFVEACPGSGKTEIIAMKAAYEYQNWPLSNKGIAILTFTRNSAEVITQRVTQYAGIAKSGYPHFVGTLDSWLHQYIAHPFSHLLTGYGGKGFDCSIRLVEDTSSSSWLSTYRCGFPYLSPTRNTPKQIPRYANMLRYDLDKKDWEVQTTKTGTYVTVKEYFDSTEFQSFCTDHPTWTLDGLRANCAQTKSKFWRSGFATYDDIELLSYRLLASNDLSKKLATRFPLLIVDECQDLSFCQLRILGRISQAGAKLHFVGDLNQAIYEFRKVDPQRVKSFVDAYSFENRSLPDNFRSCQGIVDLCSKLVTTKNVRGRESDVAGHACVYFKYNHPDELAEIPSQFERYLQSRNILIDHSAILARGRGTISKLQALQPQKQQTHPTVKLALAIFLWLKKDFAYCDESLKSLAEFISLKCFKTDRGTFQKYYCPSALDSPARWRIFLVRTLEECAKASFANMDQTWSQWAKAAHEEFFEIANRCRDSICGEVLPFETSTIKSPNGYPSLNVAGTLSKPRIPRSAIRISTIHGVKGETFDAILLVSPTSKGQGGHWKEWLADRNEEPARFAYVASSRPREILAWAVCAPKTDDENKLRALGFHFEQLPSVSP